ncbi:hypothetical protein Slin14017_G123460 [Septoria linicola]|nr:hypothetical protein Slin14017_G123460 [Septoria linicola]
MHITQLLLTIVMLALAGQATAIGGHKQTWVSETATANATKLEGCLDWLHAELEKDPREAPQTKITITTTSTAGYAVISTFSAASALPSLVSAASPLPPLVSSAVLSGSASSSAPLVAPRLAALLLESVGDSLDRAYHDALENSGIFKIVVSFEGGEKASVWVEKPDMHDSVETPVTSSSPENGTTAANESISAEQTRRRLTKSDPYH